MTNDEYTQQYFVNTAAEALAELTASPPSVAAVLAVLRAAEIEISEPIVMKRLRHWLEEVEKRALDPFYTSNELALELRKLVTGVWDQARASALQDLKNFHPKIERLSDEVYELEERVQRTFEQLEDLMSPGTDGWNALQGNQHINELLENFEAAITAQGQDKS